MSQLSIGATAGICLVLLKAHRIFLSLEGVGVMDDSRNTDLYYEDYNINHGNSENSVLFSRNLRGSHTSLSVPTDYIDSLLPFNSSGMFFSGSAQDMALLSARWNLILGRSKIPFPITLLNFLFIF